MLSLLSKASCSTVDSSSNGILLLDESTLESLSSLIDQTNYIVTLTVHLVLGMKLRYPLFQGSASTSAILLSHTNKVGANIGSHRGEVLAILHPLSSTAIPMVDCSRCVINVLYCAGGSP